MPCPADPSHGGDAVEVDRFQLFDHSDNAHVNYLPNDHYQPSLTASKIVTHHLPLEGLDINAPTRLLQSSGGLFPSLKAIPLASYYKLHRVPSLSAMTDPESDNSDLVDAIQLPHRELTSEPPQERAPHNGIHNKILEQVVRTPGRQPSPQPTHLSVPGSSQHKMLHEEGSGYVAPKFEGKELQMDQGTQLQAQPLLINLLELTTAISSHGPA
jgi:hypothetical protein